MSDWTCQQSGPPRAIPFFVDALAGPFMRDPQRAVPLACGLVSNIP